VLWIPNGAWPIVTSADPVHFVVPDGSIELRDAIRRTVELWWGRKYVDELTPEAVKLEVCAPPKERQREKRWRVVKRCFLRAFRREHLGTFVRDCDKRNRLHKTFWMVWENAWRRFEIDALGDPNQPVILLDLAEWERWSSKRSSLAKAVAVATATNDLPYRAFKNRTGPRRVKKDGAVAAIIAAVDGREVTLQALREMREKELGRFYRDARRTTLRDARDEAVRQLTARQNSDKTPTNDK
jgi:hypothetical protein